MKFLQKFDFLVKCEFFFIISVVTNGCRIASYQCICWRGLALSILDQYTLWKAVLRWVYLSIWGHEGISSMLRETTLKVMYTEWTQGSCYFVYNPEIFMIIGKQLKLNWSLWAFGCVYSKQFYVSVSVSDRACSRYLGLVGTLRWCN
jgi:hypothetical protein